MSIGQIHASVDLWLTSLGALQVDVSDYTLDYQKFNPAQTYYQARAMQLERGEFSDLGEGATIFDTGPIALNYRLRMQIDIYRYVGFEPDAEHEWITGGLDTILQALLDYEPFKASPFSTGQTLFDKSDPPFVYRDPERPGGGKVIAAGVEMDLVILLEAPD